MSKNLRSILVIFSLSLSLSISGCGLQALLGNKNKTSSTKAGTEEFIAVSLNDEDPNKLLITKGIDDLAKKENVQVKYIDPGAESKESSMKGAKILIYQGGNESLLKNAETSKVPVLALTQLPSDTKVAGIVTPDQEKAGELMAQTLVSKVTEGQILIMGDPNETTFQERLAGNKAILSKYPKITVQNIVSSPDSESAAKQGLTDFLQKNPGKLQGILAHTEKLANIANEVLKQAQLDKKVILVGGQASVPSLERMSSGTQVGDVDTSPYLQGVSAYEWARKIMKKESLDVNDSITSDQGEIPAKVIQVKAVTPDNLALVQKSYTKTMESAEQDKKQTQSAEQDSKAQDQGQANKDNQSKDNQSKDNSGSSGSGDKQSPSGSMPPGVQKVTERIKTETTREYLDAQGKVIGTEKTTNEQVKTVPPDMLEQKSDQSKGASQDQGNQSSGDKSKQE